MLQLMLLQLVEQPAADYCAKRQQVAIRLRDTPDEDLTNRYNDFEIKLKHAFADELNQAAASGTCPSTLFSFMRLVRSKLPSETQDIEGMNSVLQRMAKLAPNLQMAMASDRLGIKTGDRITVEDN